MSSDIEFIVPGPDYRADPDMRIFWDKLGTLFDVARTHLPPDKLFSVALSRITREMRAEWDATTARAILQGFVDSMEKSAANDRDRT